MLLRRNITDSTFSEKSLPTGIVIRRFIPALHAPAARALLNHSYATGAGHVEIFDEWWPALEADKEYDPELCFVAENVEDGALAAFAQCWTSGFVKDFAVATAFRRRGLGRAMMEEISSRFAARGCVRLDLRVVPVNVAAIRFYRLLGFYPVSDA